MVHVFILFKTGKAGSVPRNNQDTLIKQEILADCGCEKERNMIRSLNHAKHPMQPIGFAEDKVIRFKRNAIVRYLLDAGSLDLNKLAIHGGFSKDDWTQFYQLIGYSVSGFGELSLVDKKTIKEADAIADKLYRKKHDKKS